MPLRVGTTPVAAVQVGSTPVIRAYQDGARVFGDEPVQQVWGWGSSSFGERLGGSGVEPNWMEPLSDSNFAAPDPYWLDLQEVSGSVLALRYDGTLFGWGRNLWGVLGQGDTNPRDTTIVQIGPVGVWKQISLSRHVAAVRKDGSMWCWGRGDSGQLGQNDTNSRSTPTRVGTLNDWVWVAAGTSSTSAVTRTNFQGRLWGWGTNSSGQLALGDQVDRLIPTATPQFPGISVPSSYPFRVAFDSFYYDTGVVWQSWGSNSRGQLGRTGDNRLRLTIPTSGSSSGQPRIVDIAAGSTMVLAIRGNGEVWRWGRRSLLSNQQDDEPVLLNNPETQSLGLIKIVRQTARTLGLSPDRKIWQIADGNGESGFPPVLIDNRQGWRDIWARASSGPFPDLFALRNT